VKSSIEGLQPPEDMPIWVHLAFAEMVPKTYSYDNGCSRRPEEAVVTGFTRLHPDTVWVYYYMDWPYGERVFYAWPADKWEC
jgi:hypothetical protein